MVSYEEALKIAKGLKPDIDKCTEYENAYVFGSTEDDNYDGGAGHVPCVIMKDTGKALSFPFFLTHYPVKEIKTFTV